MQQRSIPRISPAHPSHTHPHRHLSLHLDRARLRKDTRPIAVSLLRPGPHGSVGAASTRALDQIPECSSMIGSVASLFRHPGTLPDNHAIYSSPCIHFPSDIITTCCCVRIVFSTHSKVAWWNFLTPSPTAIYPTTRSNLVMFHHASRNIAYEQVPSDPSWSSTVRSATICRHA